MWMVKRLSALVLLSSLILLAGCSAHKQYYCGEFPKENLKTLKPQYVASKQGKIEYYRFGTGSPLVMISGYTADVTSWDNEFLASLAERHDVIVFNNRNVGGSVVQSRRYASEDMAKDTYQLVRALKLKKPAILGLSMGGMIAQDYALHYPHSLSRLILINTAMAGDKAPRPKQAVVKAMLDMPDNRLQRYVLALDLFTPPQSKMQMALALARDRFQPQTYSEVVPSQVKQDQSLYILDWLQDNKAAKQLAQLPMPVLILNGRADQVIPPQNSDILNRTIPKSQLITWKEGGHAMIYQYPQEIAQAVNKFLA